MNLSGLTHLTYDQIKDKIVTEFYKTGKVEGIYMNAKSTSKQNAFKKYISMKLGQFYKIYNEQQEYLDDLYQLTFELLWKIPTERFINSFFDSKGEFIHSKFTATACLIVQRKGFNKMPNGSNKSSLMTNILFASSYDDDNIQINTSFDDRQKIDEYLIDYINPDFIEEILNDADRELYEKMLVKETKYYYNTKNPVYKEFANKLRKIKKNGL